MMRPNKVIAGLLAGGVMLASSGCGGSGSAGGGGTAGGTSPPVNTAPTFISASSVSVIENAAATIYTATATDAESNAITFSIAGGADAGRFAITGAGALGFVSAPNFDLAGDADGDNVYQVQLSASDGSTSSTLTLAVTVTNSKEGVQVRRVATGLTDTSAFAVIDANRVLIASSTGIGVFDTRTGVLTQLLSSGALSGTILALRPAPDFASTGTIFVMQRQGTFVIVRRLLRGVAGYSVSNASEDYFVDVAGYLGGGWLGIDGDTILAGFADSTRQVAQANETPIGKIVRISRNSDPFAGASPQPYIYQIVASGFRMPVSGSVLGNRILVADRGGSVRDEVDLFSPGGNYGWPFREGTQTVADGAPVGLLEPVAEYARGTRVRDGQGIVGVFGYRGSIASLANMALILDRSGKVFAVAGARLLAGSTVAADMFELRTLDFAPDVGAIDAPLGLDGDASGVIFVLDADGELFRLNADGG